MVVLAALNIVLFFAMWFYTRPNAKGPPIPGNEWSLRYSRAMRILVIPYLIQTTVRSWQPALYNFRITWFDTPFNNAVTNRMLAFVGEICFAFQLCLFLIVVSQNMPLKSGNRTRYLVRKWVPRGGKFIAFAGIFANIMSVAGMVSTSNLYNIIEEVFWMLIFFVLGVCCLLVAWRGCDAGFLGDDDADGRPNVFDLDTPPSTSLMRVLLRVGGIFGVLSVFYYAIVDIPRYVDRYKEELDNPLFDALGFVEGWKDAATTRNVSQDWDNVWSKEWDWMSFYFSLGTMLTISLGLAPGRLLSKEEIHSSAGPIVGA